MTGDVFRSRTLLIGGGVACAVTAGAAFLYYRFRREVFVEVGQISQIFIHPVKSFRAIEVQSAECTSMGLKYKNLMDRSWVLIDGKDRFVTASQLPKMAIIRTSLSEDGKYLYLDAPNMSTMELPIQQSAGDNVQIKIFGQAIEGRDCGREVSKWLCQYFDKKGYRLLHFDPGIFKTRKVNELPHYKELATKDKDQSVFQNFSPFMLLSESSLVTLNEHLDKKVQMRNFRPNFVVNNCAPFEEDKWKKIKIGDVVLRHLKFCNRCPTTKVNPDSGILDNEEPLKTLKIIRPSDPSKKHLYKNGPLFGVILAIDTCGTISVGDTVYASKF